MNDTAKNERERLARLLLQHRDSLFAYILAMVRDGNAAEDLFQEVSLVILKKEQRGDGAVRDFGAWSREIARRMTLQYWKTKKKESVLISGGALAGLEAAFARHDRDAGGRTAELLEKLRRCLDELPAHIRGIVELRYAENVPLAEMGQRLNRSPGAVQVALSRARARLLDCTKRGERGTV